ncbi:MAG: hypothetical protein KDE27_19575, partial [Planctomycetes bacterium]|nr:hypothetical protein [Planctomycetota bacterium]
MSTHEPERDYLWDREGEPDPLVQRLEGLLRDFGHDGRALPPLRRPRRRWPLWTAAAVAAAAGIVFTVLATTPEPQLQPGAAPRTFAAGKEPVVVPLGELAAITLRPGGELRFEHWRDDQALFRLERGALTARVAPPPAVAPDFFCIDTALGRVTDK